MAITAQSRVGGHSDRLFHTGTLTGLSDGELLEQFRTQRDATAELAFEALVKLHGPMVMGVCRRLLRNPEDADDAFQATFLILARKAGTIRGSGMLGAWLHRVARHTAAACPADHRPAGRARAPRCRP